MGKTVLTIVLVCVTLGELHMPTLCVRLRCPCGLR